MVLKLNLTLKEIKFFLVAGVFDKPAKSAVLNMISSTGYFGCTKCLQPGESFKVNKEQRGQSHIYPFKNEDPQGPLRTDECYLYDLNKGSSTNSEINGVKGPCAHSVLKYFNTLLRLNDF